MQLEKSFNLFSISTYIANKKMPQLVNRSEFMKHKAPLKITQNNMKLE